MLFCASTYLFKFNKRQHAVWVRRNLQKRQQYGVYNTLLADLAASDDQRVVRYVINIVINYVITRWLLIG